jgi:hypothetical protein
MMAVSSAVKCDRRPERFMLLPPLHSVVLFSAGFQPDTVQRLGEPTWASSPVLVPRDTDEETMDAYSTESLTARAGAVHLQRPHLGFTVLPAHHPGH